METTLIRSLIASYFAIVRQTIQDIVPKAIMHLLVNHSRDSIQQRLVTNLYKPDLFQDLLYEDEALVSERSRVKALLDAYKEAFRWVLTWSAVVKRTLELTSPAHAESWPKSPSNRAR
jgi:dynamin 1-like protein